MSSTDITSGKSTRLAIVIPCYNEEEALPLTVARLTDIIGSMVGDGLVASDSYIMCCDDGSRDATWRTIRNLHASNPMVRGLSLAHNRGHQYALLAGLMTVRNECDAAISIDADL